MSKKSLLYVCEREKERDKECISVCMCIESGTTASIVLDYSEDGDNEIFNPDKRDSLSLITSTVKYVCLKHGTDAKKHLTTGVRDSCAVE